MFGAEVPNVRSRGTEYSEQRYRMFGAEVTNVRSRSTECSEQRYQMFELTFPRYSALKTDKVSCPETFLQLRPIPRTVHSIMPTAGKLSCSDYSPQISLKVKVHKFPSRPTYPVRPANDYKQTHPTLCLWLIPMLFQRSDPTCGALSCLQYRYSGPAQRSGHRISLSSHVAFS